MNNINLEGERILCLVEGAAEKAIMDILLAHDLMIFDKGSLFYKKPLMRESVRIIEKKYLSLNVGQAPIVILRIIDSRREQFKLSKLYRHKVKEVYTAHTPPEVEILIILLDDCCDEYCKSGQKPSEYCKKKYGKGVKTVDFINKKFKNPEELVRVIKRHKSTIGKDTMTLAEF